MERLTDQKVEGTTERYLRVDKDYICSAYDMITEEKYEFVEMILNRLALLEDKIENGTLVELPCKVGDTIYEINSCSNKVNETKARHLWDILRWKDDNLFGRWLFTDKAEAEQRLKELKVEV